MEALRRCDPTLPIATMAGAGLGTSWRVRFVDRSAMPVERLRTAIEARLAGIVAEMSQWEPTSHLSRFNRAPAGAWMSLPPDFATVIAAALDIAARSGGAFDPTHGRAAALLGFGAEATDGAPSAADLADAHATAGWQRLDFDPAGRRLRQPGGLWLDLSGIAKGFAVEAVTDVLAQHGFPDALVEIGGELAGRGLKPDGQPWWVDLETASDTPAPPLRVGLHDLAVATSGDYVRGAHTIDPCTGHPLAPVVASVSVLHPSAMIADAWATALTVLGPIEAQATATREGLAARLVSRGTDGPIETLSALLMKMIGMDDRAPAPPPR